MATCGVEMWALSPYCTAQTRIITSSSRPHERYRHIALQIPSRSCLRPKHLLLPDVSASLLLPLSPPVNHPEWLLDVSFPISRQCCRRLPSDLALQGSGVRRSIVNHGVGWEGYSHTLTHWQLCTVCWGIISQNVEDWSYSVAFFFHRFTPTFFSSIDFLKTVCWKVIWWWAPIDLLSTCV